MPGANDPLVRQISSTAFTDSEIKRLLINAAAEVGGMSSTSDVRRAQKRLANHMVQTWGGVGDAIKVGIGDAVYGATEYQALFDEEMFAKAGVSSRYWRASQIATASEGIQSVISRKENGITLSQKVWKNGQLSQKHLNDTINAGLALGKSPSEIAKSVVQYISPTYPGGASYAAMRLGRSEVLNAYHTTSIRNYKKTPWIDKCKWNLSGSHPRPDACNEYAEQGNLKNGLWSLDQVPAKPHPNCLCFITPVQMDFDKYVKEFQAGKYDDYIEKQMGCYRAG